MGLDVTHSLLRDIVETLTDVTLAGDYTNSIQADGAKRAIQNNVVMQVAPLVAKFVTNASGAIWRPNF